MITHITPELPVSSVYETQRYYQNVLGFQIDWIHEKNFGAVSRDDVVIYFFYERRPQPDARLYVLVDNVQELYEELKAKGAIIIEELVERKWGAREFRVQDVNGHILRFGQQGKRLREIEGVKLIDKK